MPVIYLDVLIALNWLIDFVLLSATQKMLHIPVKRFRVILGALIGGCSACIVLLPTLPTAIQLAVNVAVAAEMIAVAFPLCRWMVFLKRTIVFLVISLLFSGVIAFFCRFLQGETLLVHNGEVYADLSPLTLTVFALITYGIMRLCEYWTRRRMPKGGEYRLRIWDGEQEYVGRALCDTGLHLQEPFSGASVIVLERTAAEVCLTSEIKQAIDQQKVCPRLRMIPYRTVGGEGLLPAFRPRRVQLGRLGETEQDISGVYVALCDELGCGEYEALIGTECTEGWRER